MSTIKSMTPTVDELLATIRNSQLPTVIVEGSDDLLVYLKLEEILYDHNVSILAAGGRNNVLGIFERASEIPKNKKIAFIADKDNWVITGIPDKYIANNLIFTSGYSIENDVFQDCDIPKFMCEIEKRDFHSELEKFLHWYALAVDRQISLNEGCIKTHPNHILDNPKEFQCLTKLKANENYPTARLEHLKSEYKNLVRGKSLIQLALRQLSYKGRRTRHSDSNFLEYSAVHPGPLISKIFKEAETALLK